MSTNTIIAILRHEYLMYTSYCQVICAESKGEVEAVTVKHITFNDLHCLTAREQPRASQLAKGKSILSLPFFY